MLSALVRSASLRAAAALALGGVAFTLGNLILARALSSADYGLVSLFIGIVAVSGLTAPLGLDLVVGRRGYPLVARWRRGVLAASATVAVATAGLSLLLYPLGLGLLLCVVITTIAAGATQASAAHFQGQRHFGSAVWILQFSNWSLVPVALIAALCGFQRALACCILITVAAVLAGIVAWLLVLRSEALVGEDARELRTLVPPHPGVLLTEALSLVMITTSSSVFLQLERLVVAPMVGMRQLALFGVLASLVGSPFRMLQAAVQFTLVPELRAATGSPERQRLLRREALLVGTTVAAGSAVIWLVAPPIAHWFLGGRYDLSDGLLLAGLVSGVLKVFCAFSLAIVVALAQEKALRLLSAISWGAIAISVAGAYAGAQWGLIGVLYGISLGWLVRSGLAMWVAIPHLREAKPALRPHPILGSSSRSG